METVLVEHPASFASIVRDQEALLRAGGPVVHVAVLDGSVVSAGVGVPENAAYLRRAESLGVPTAQRSSGGTGILHLDGDLLWSVVLPRSDPRVGRDFVQGYPRFGAGLVTALSEYAVPSRWVPSPGLSDEYCPLGSRGQVLDVHGQVLGAAAQHLTGPALLHHGTLSVRVDRSLVARIFSFSDASAVDRLSGITDLGVRESPARVAAGVARALARTLDRG